MFGTRGALLIVGLVVILGACTDTSDDPADKPRPPVGAPVSPAPPSPASPVLPASPSATPQRARWVPTPGTAWQWQLNVPVNQTYSVPVYDIDGFENSATVVSALKAKGKRVICYIDVGAAENFRPDYSSYPATVLGKTNGWQGERWLDIRQLDILRPILAKRFDMCRAKGFDAVEADVMDHFTNYTGFPITASHQLAFARMVATLAHDRGLSVGLKNNPEQAAVLVKDFDFAVVEECAEFDECAEYSPFINAGKAVFHVEYALANAEFCPGARSLKFSSMRKNLALDAPRWPC